VGHKPNDLREHKNITTLPTSRLKGCVHTNEAKKHPSEKLQGGAKLVPKPKVKENGPKRNLMDLTHKQGNSFKSMTMPGDKPCHIMKTRFHN
jgi:hypothetical protein